MLYLLTAHIFFLQSISSPLLITDLLLCLLLFDLSKQKDSVWPLCSQARFREYCTTVHVNNSFMRGDERKRLVVKFRNVDMHIDLKTTPIACTKNKAIKHFTLLLQAKKGAHHHTLQDKYGPHKLLYLNS